jgi:hypothetical protein
VGQGRNDSNMSLNWKPKGTKWIIGFALKSIFFVHGQSRVDCTSISGTGCMCVHLWCLFVICIYIFADRSQVLDNPPETPCSRLPRKCQHVTGEDNREFTS